MVLRKIMIFQHVGHEPLGTLNPMLKAAGFRIRYVNFGREPDAVPDLEGYYGLIILGGPMGVYEAHLHPHLRIEMKLIEEALKRGIPVLGICLGAQMIAAVLGAHVRKADQWELGWYPFIRTEHGESDALYSHYEKVEHVFQIHQDMFDVPKTAVHLGRSDMVEGQAFRFGSKVYGLQFHLEVDHAMVRRWMARDENRKLVAEHHRLFSLEKIEKDTERYISRSLELSTQTFGKFIELFNLPDRPVLLGSSHGKPPKGER